VPTGHAFCGALEASPVSACHVLAEAKVRELASRVLWLDARGIENKTPRAVRSHIPTHQA
jgi:hypothetical protein